MVENLSDVQQFGACLRIQHPLSSLADFISKLFVRYCRINCAIDHLANGAEMTAGRRCSGSEGSIM